MLTNRPHAYGYWHTERFLSQLAQANGADIFTDALAEWTARLWHASLTAPSTFYVDGHRKPVYSDVLLPRGLVGWLSSVLGCRALVLLHDEQGHPLLATTHRGDQYLTVGLPSIVARYEQAVRGATVERVVVDREGMAAEFLSSLGMVGRIVVSVLRTDQYDSLESFTEIGSFVPFCLDQEGNVSHEVAPASITLPLPDHPGESLTLRVALIRNLRRHIPVGPPKEEDNVPPQWDADLDDMVAERVESNSNTSSPDDTETHSYRDHCLSDRCRRDRPDVHPSMARPRKYHQRFPLTAWP